MTSGARRRAFGRTAGWLCLSPVFLIGACVATRVHGDEAPPVVAAPSRPTADSGRPAEPFDIPRDAAPKLRTEGERDVRVALATSSRDIVLTANGPFRLFDARNSVLVRARAGDKWTVERRGHQLRAVRTGSGATVWSDELLTLRPDREDDFGVFAGRRFRGSLRLVATDSGVILVNLLPVEDYLRGVVPLEIGDRSPNEQAAVEAQAIAARSYAFVRLAAIDAGAARNASYDVLSGVSDQVYGGADAERASSDRAVSATAGLVLTYGSRVVSAPYSSTCGGQTASPEDVWRSGPEPFLRRVSDRIPGSANRFYCDMAPQFAWTRTFSGDELDAAMRSYLRSYVAVPAGGPGRTQRVLVESRTPGDRVGRLAIQTDRATYVLRGNDVRYVLRPPGGEILNSTYFSVETELRRDGALDRVVVRGNGYGHGIGMCQWGAIGRARAGQSARAILATYYPGTVVGRAR